MSTLPSDKAGGFGGRVLSPLGDKATTRCGSKLMMISAVVYSNESVPALLIPQCQSESSSPLVTVRYGAEALLNLTERCAK